MTPLETAARALVVERNKNLPVTDAPIDWEYISRNPENEWYRFYMGQARAALLAVAECDLPDEAIDEAEEARIEAIEAHRKHQAEIWANIGKPIPDNAKGTAAFTWMPPAFKALIRSIATEGKDND